MVTVDGKVRKRSGACRVTSRCLLDLTNLQVHTVDVVDATAENRNAEHFLQLLEDAKKKAEEELGVEVICVVSDASGEAAKARRIFAKKYPRIIVLDCFAHQVRLLSGVIRL